MSLTKDEIERAFHEFRGFYKHWVGYDIYIFILDMCLSKEEWKQIKNSKELNSSIISSGFIKEIDDMYELKIKENV